MSTPDAKSSNTKPAAGPDLTRSWFDILPRITFAWWETLCMRIGFAWLLYSKYPALQRLPHADEPLTFPNGIAKWVDLTWALQPDAYNALRLSMVIACFVYASGFAFPIASTVLFVCYLVPGTLQNSLGSFSHYYQMMTLLLLAQALASWIYVLGNKKRVLNLATAPSPLHSFVTRVTLQVIAANYVLCGLTKLILTDGKWIWNSQYMPLQFEKIKWQHYHNALVSTPPNLADRLNEFAIHNPWFSMMAYAPGLFAELGAIALLFGRAWSLWTGLFVIGMHFVIMLTMRLSFQQHESMMWIYAVNIPFWTVWLVRKLLKLDRPKLKA